LVVKSLIPVKQFFMMGFKLNDKVSKILIKNCNK